jgi:chromosome segregation ATPase
VNCPKCGYSQEERSDCKRCGIVFAKYFAIYKAADLPETHAPVAADNGAAEMAEMQRVLRDLAKRYGEIEFERAERQRLREDIREIEHRQREESVGLSARISEVEKALNAVLDATRLVPEEVEQIKRSVWERLDPVLKKIDQIESRLDALAREPKNDPKLMDVLGKLEQRVADSEAIAARAAAESKTSGSATDLAEMRAALQAVSLRYSEIADLKKNHLVLLNKLETLQREFEAAKNNGNKVVVDKIREMEIEVPALRAEVRQMLKHLEALDAAAQSSADEVTPMNEEIDAIMKAVTDLGAEVALLRAELSQVEEHLAPPPIEAEPDPVAPLEADVRAIRNDMKEILSFIYSLGPQALSSKMK